MKTQSNKFKPFERFVSLFRQTAQVTSIRCCERNTHSLATMLNARRYHGATTPPKEPYHDVDSLTSAIDGMNHQGQEGHRHSDASSNGSIQAEQTELQKELDLIFEKQAREKLDNVPTYEMPSQFRPGLNLFDHQVEGIRWLVHQERNGGAEASTPRKRPKGSILADGK